MTSAPATAKVAEYRFKVPPDATDLTQSYPNRKNVRFLPL